VGLAGPLAVKNLDENCGPTEKQRAYLTAWTEKMWALGANDYDAWEFHCDRFEQGSIFPFDVSIPIVPVSFGSREARHKEAKRQLNDLVDMGLAAHAAAIANSGQAG